MDRTPMVIKRELSPDDKVAVLLASLEPKLAATILQQLEPSVMLRVTNALRRLGVVPGPIRDKAIAECLRGIQDLGFAVQGNDNTASSLLLLAVGEKKASALLFENKAAQGSFTELATMSPEQIFEILAREQPSVISLVLRHLPPAISAGTLALLAPELRKKVMVYMCVSVDPSAEIVSRIEALLTAKVASMKKSTKKKISETDKVTVLTSIIQLATPSMSAELLNAIQEKSETLAAEIRDRLFTFEDVVKLSDSAIRRLMQEIDTSVLSVALRNANMDLRQKFFKNMSKRAAQALKEEIEFSHKMRRSEIDARQKEIVNIVRTLEADGQLSTTTTDEYI